MDGGVGPAPQLEGAKLTVSTPARATINYRRPDAQNALPTTESVGLGLIGFATNCLLVVFNTIGTEKKDPEKNTPGWGLAHLSLGSMMVIVGVSDYLTNPFGADPRRDLPRGA